MGCKKNPRHSNDLVSKLQAQLQLPKFYLEPIYLHRVDVVLRAANHTCGPVQTGRGLEGDCEVVGL